MMKKILLATIRAYQYVLSPLMGRSCRFYPSCSSYMMTAINRFGVLTGLYLGAKRLCRCHPFTKGGHDPVPAEFRSKLSACCARNAASQP